MEGGSRAGELRKLSSSLSPAIPSKLTWTSLSQLSWVSLSQLSLGTRDYGNVCDVLQKINNTMKCIIFCTPNQGWKIAFGSIGVKKTMKFYCFVKKLASQTPKSQRFQIARCGFEIARCRTAKIPNYVGTGGKPSTWFPPEDS